MCDRRRVCLRLVKNDNGEPERMYKVTTSILTILCALIIASPQDIPPIRNFVRVNEQFCTGGQPRLEHLQQLKDEGVKAIINLRPPAEHRAAEEEA
jgi:hypothetical protein